MPHPTPGLVCGGHPESGSHKSFECKQAAEHSGGCLVSPMLLDFAGFDMRLARNSIGCWLQSRLKIFTGECQCFYWDSHLKVTC